MEQQQENVQVTMQVDSQGQLPDSIPAKQLTQELFNPPDRDRRFGLSISLNKTIFEDGDEVEITVNSESNGYLSLFDVTSDGHITVLAPNRFLKIVNVQAGKDFIFPNRLLKSRGAKLRAWVPAGTRQVKENIKAVVTKEPISLLEGKVPEGIYRQSNPTETALLKDLLIALSSFDPSEWAEASVNYKITKRR